MSDIALHWTDNYVLIVKPEPHCCMPVNLNITTVDFAAGQLILFRQSTQSNPRTDPTRASVSAH